MEKKKYSIKYVRSHYHNEELYNQLLTELEKLGELNVISQDYFIIETDINDKQIVELTKHLIEAESTFKVMLANDNNTSTILDSTRNKT